MIPPVPFAGAPTPVLPLDPALLIDGGPVAIMHRALQVRLQAAFPSPQFQHRTAPPRFTPQEFARFTERAPVVGLGWVNMKPMEGRAVRPRIWSGRANWVVFLVVKNPRVEALVLGDGLGPGLMGMLAVAAAALQGHSIGGIGPAEVGECGQAYSDTWASEGLALATLAISVPFDLVDLGRARTAR